MALINIEVTNDYAGKEKKPFLKLTDVDIGESITITSEHRTLNGNYGEQTIVDVNCKGQVYSMALNKTSVMNLVSAFGQDSSSWIGKSVKVGNAHSKKYNKTYKSLFA